MLGIQPTCTPELLLVERGLLKRKRGSLVPMRMLGILRMAALLLMIGAAGLLWMSGLIDLLFARSYAEFSWPPNVELDREVDHIIRTRRSVIDPPNIWNRSIDIMPDCGVEGYREAPQDRRLLVIVKSKVDNFEAREAIRSTWGAERLSEWRLRFVFLVAGSEDSSISSRVMQEEDEHHDILLSNDFIDQYYNNGKKFGLSLWLSSSSPLSFECPSAFTLLIDDDYIVSVRNLMHLISSRRGNEPLYEGWQMEGSEPYRWRFHKHSVSYFDYPFDEYPPYITAGAVLLSAHTVERFYYGSLFLKQYAFDDIYAGILAKMLSIVPHHNEAFPFWSKAAQSIDWNTTIAAHGFSASDIISYYSLTKA